MWQILLSSVSKGCHEYQIRLYIYIHIHITNAHNAHTYTGVFVNTKVIQQQVYSDKFLFFQPKKK